MEQKAPLGMKRAGKMRVFSRPRFTLVVAPLLLLTILAVLPLFGPGPNIIRLLFVTFVWVTVSSRRRSPSTAASTPSCRFYWLEVLPCWRPSWSACPRFV